MARDKEENRINSNQVFVVFVAFFLWSLAAALSSWVSTDQAQAGMWFIYPKTCHFELDEVSFKKLSWAQFCALSDYAICDAHNESVFDLETIDQLCLKVDFSLMKLVLVAAAVLSSGSFFLGGYMIHGSTRVSDIVAVLPFALLVSAGR